MNDELEEEPTNDTNFKVETQDFASLQLDDLGKPGNGTRRTENDFYVRPYRESRTIYRFYNKSPT